MNIPFYTDEDNFFFFFLGIDKEKYISNLLNNEEKNLNSKNFILPYKGNLYIPLNNNERNNNNNLIDSSYKNKFLTEILNDEENQSLIIDGKDKIKISKIHFIGEVLYLLRPAIYLSLIAVFNNNKIIPLIINICLDILIYLARMEINSNNFMEYGMSFLVQKLHYYEMKFRNKNFLVYIFREPIFSGFIKPLLIKILNVIFLPEFIKNIIIELLDYYSNYVFIA